MKFPKKKTLGTACFTGELYQMFKEEITPVLRTSFKKTKQKHFPIHVIKLVFTDTKTKKFVKIQYQKKKKKHHKPINTPHEYGHTNVLQNISK